MVEFTCLHCNTFFSVADGLAGRQGWCRSCKRMIMVPMPDGSGGVDQLSLDERCTRLDRLVQYAATKADRYRLLLYQAQQEMEKLHLRLNAADEQVERLRSAEDRLIETQGALDGLVREVERGAAVRDQLHEQNEELHRQNAQLLSELAEEKAARANADKRLSDTRRLRRDDRRRVEEEIEALRAQLARVESAASGNGDWEAVLRERDHLRGALDAAQQQRRDAEQRLALAEAARAAVEAERAEKPEDSLQDEVAALRAQVAETESAWEASEQQRIQAEEAVALREQELTALRDVERRHRNLARKLETLESGQRALQEALEAAQAREVEAVSRVAEVESAQEALRDELARVREERDAAAQARKEADRAREIAEQTVAVRLAEMGDAFAFSSGEESVGPGDEPAGTEEGGRRTGWGLFGRSEKVELVPLGEPLQGGDAGMILTPDLFGDDPLTDNFMSFLDVEPDDAGDEMPA